MKKYQIKEMIMDLLGQIDYDMMKSFDPETAEEPEQAEKSMDKLVALVQKHLKAGGK